MPLDEPLDGARLTNEALLAAIRALSLVTSRSGGGRRRVDFGNLGAEELGSVYESLLEMVPRYDPEQLSYTLTVLAGNERKESGSYYTPTSLVDCLLDSALDPLLDEACKHATARRTSCRPARPHRLRPGLRLGPLPRGGGPPDRQASRRRGNR